MTRGPDSETRRRWKRLFEETNDILFDVWDPIDVGSNDNLWDEYQSFVPPIVRMIMRGATTAEFEEHLRSIEAGLVSAPDERRRAAAERLENLSKSFRT